jgi:hypothetical protein
LTWHDFSGRVPCLSSQQKSCLDSIEFTTGSYQKKKPKVSKKVYEKGKVKKRRGGKEEDKVRRPKLRTVHLC